MAPAKMGVAQMTQTTYEAIKAIPGKGFDWNGFVGAVRDMQIITRSGMNRIPDPYAEEFASMKGIGDKRRLAMWYATLIVHDCSKSSKFIPPSQETLSWGGFLGGDTVVLTDEDAAQEATDKIICLIPEFQR